MSFEKDIVETKLKKLLGGRSFSICDLDEIGKLIGSHPRQHENYKYLHALHCVSYSDMSPTVREQLPSKVMECLRPGSLDFGLMATALMREGSQATSIEDRYIEQSNIARLTGRR